MYAVTITHNLIISSLEKLNKLRNKIAHNINPSISNKDIVALFNGLEDELPYGDISADHPKDTIRKYIAFIYGEMLPKYEEDI